MISYLKDSQDLVLLLYFHEDYQSLYTGFIEVITRFILRHPYDVSLFSNVIILHKCADLLLKCIIKIMNC